MKKRKANRKQKHKGGIGNLNSVPFLYPHYTCHKCGKTFSFLISLKCDCGLTKGSQKKTFLRFGAQRVVVNDILFQSMVEAKRYSKLAFCEKAGTIYKLELQPVYPLHVNGKKIGVYRADFRYWLENLQWVEDVKTKETDLFKWKIKHVLAEYPDINFALSK